MLILRLVRTFFRGLRPLSKSLDSIAADLHTMRRLYEYRANLEGLTLPDENLMRKARIDDMTEVSWNVAEPEINPETGKPVVEEDDWQLDMRSIFGRK